MARWRVESDRGEMWRIVAPEDATEAEVRAFVNENADKWRNGATYHLDFDGTPAPVEQPAPDTRTPRNKFADSEAALADEKIKEIRQAIADVSNRQGRTRAVLLGGRGEGDVAADREEMKRLQEQLTAWRNYKRKFEVGESYAGAGGVGMALTGAGLGGAIGGPPGAVIGGILGAAGGTGVGSLWDIEEAREQRDITDAQAKALIANRVATSLIIDGAFALVLGPGGRALGKIARNSPAFQEMSRVAREVFDWNEIKGAAKAQKDAVISKRADAMLPGTSQSVTDALSRERGPGVTAEGIRRLPERDANQALLEDMARSSKSGQAVPSLGNVTGYPHEVRGETLARRIAPDVFQISDANIGQAAFAIRDRALRALDDSVQGEHLGNAVSRVVQSADATLKRVYGPVFDRARDVGSRVNVSPAIAFLDKQIARKGWSATEQSELTQLRAKLVGNQTGPFQRTADFGDVQDIMQRLKALQRGRLTGNEVPSKEFTGIMGDAIGELDDAYMASLTKADKAVAADLASARNAYKLTMTDLYSDAMAALAVKNPEDVGRVLLAKGTVTEIRELRKALVRAFKNAPRKPRVTLAERRATARDGQTFPVREMGKEQMMEEMRRIDAGLIKGFIEKETSRLQTLDVKLLDQEFRQTLKELLTGPNMSDRTLGSKILTELDRINGALRLVHPEVLRRGAPPGSEVAMGGFGAGSLMAAASPGPIGMTSVIGWLALNLGGRALAKAVATAMTNGNTGILRKIHGALKLGHAAGKSPAAAEAGTRLVHEILQELNIDPMEIENGTAQPEARPE